MFNLKFTYVIHLYCIKEIIISNLIYSMDYLVLKYNKPNTYRIRLIWVCKTIFIKLLTLKLIVSLILFIEELLKQ